MNGSDRQTVFENIFPTSDPDRREIWDILVRRDIEAFADNDWARHETDFLSDTFFGIDAGGSANPDDWRACFGFLAQYAVRWRAFAAASFTKLPRAEITRQHLAATTLRDIELNGDLAIAHKKFDGIVAYPDGTKDRLDWQTIYICRRARGRWWIAGFIGFLPHRP